MNKWEKMGEVLSGSCTNSVNYALCAILDREPSDEEYDELLKYLTGEGIFECEECGWWTFAGEGDGEYCEQCSENH